MLQDHQVSQVRLEQVVPLERQDSQDQMVLEEPQDHVVLQVTLVPQGLREP